MRIVEHIALALSIALNIYFVIYYAFLFGIAQMIAAVNPRAPAFPNMAGKVEKTVFPMIDEEARKNDPVQFAKAIESVLWQQGVSSAQCIGCGKILAANEVSSYENNRCNHCRTNVGVSELPANH